MDRSAKYLKSLVGAPGFEPGASCAQGRRATRLRYAPIRICLIILKHYATLLQRGTVFLLAAVHEWSNRSNSNAWLRNCCSLQIPKQDAN
jgi:hypothetical protein